MGVIPKKTTPLTKFVRTGEGVLVFAFNLAMLIIPIVSSSLTPEQAVKWAGIVNGVAVICRTGLKIVAETSKATGIEPQPIGNISGQVTTADTGGSASNGGAPEVVAVPADDGNVIEPAGEEGVSGSPDDPSDADEFASTPSVDDDAVDAPETPVVTLAAPLAPPVVMVTGSANGAPDYAAGPADYQAPTYATAPSDATADAAVQGPGAAADPPDSTVSDEEEFSSVPSASDYEDDGMALEPASDDGDLAGSPEPVGAGASGVPNPIVINGGEELS